MPELLNGARKPVRQIHSANREWVTISVILIWALCVCYYNISVSPVETDEALYAAVGRQIARTSQWFRLEYERAPFLYKPPLHFWLMAISMRLWGETELGVRFPSATFGLATIFLVYFAGKAFFQRRVAVTATLITATTYNIVWLAPQGKMDVELGFWMNLAVLSFLLAYREEERRSGFLVLSFFSMTMATMLKGPVGTLLPGFAAFVYLVSTRRSGAVKEIPAFGFGLLALLGIAGAYYLALTPEFNRYFFVVENLMRITEESRPLLFYFYMIFPDLFPWSLFVPGAAVALWRSGLLRPGTHEFSVLVWFLSFLLFLSIPSYKEEDFLVYLLPPFALLMARSWAQLWPPWGTSTTLPVSLLKGSLILLILGMFAALLIGPKILQLRFPGFPDLIGPAHSIVAGLVLVCLVALYIALQRQIRDVFYAVAVIALTLTLAFVHFFRAAQGQYNAVKNIARDIRSTVGDSPLALSPTQGSTELLYYLDRTEPVWYVAKIDGVEKFWRSEKKVFALLTTDLYDELKSLPGFPTHKVAEFAHRKWHYVLIHTTEPR